MTDIEQKALALVNECAGHDFVHPRDMKDKCWLLESICCAIEQHEAYKQDVSDAVESLMDMPRCDPDEVDLVAERLARFVIAKPDPLVDAWMDAFPGNHIDDAREECAKISAALAARGLEIREKQP